MEKIRLESELNSIDKRRNRILDRLDEIRRLFDSQAAFLEKESIELGGSVDALTPKAQGSSAGSSSESWSTMRVDY